MIKTTPLSVIRALLSLPPHAMVRLYSYQSETAWNAALQRGYWCGVEQDADHQDFFSDAYRWMQEQMALRLQDFTGDLPMWAWTKRPSTRHFPPKRPVRGLKEDIRLTLLVPRGRILFSDYSRWHSVLNRTLICRNEEEWDQHCADFPDHWADASVDDRAAYFAAIVPSWSKCLAFRPAETEAEARWSGRGKRFRVQACVDRFYWSEVVSVRRFLSANVD